MTDAGSIESYSKHWNHFTIAGTKNDNPLTLRVSATASYLLSPTGVTVDLSGNVFFKDEYTNSIYKITVSTGLLRLVAGNNRYMNNGYYGDGVAASTSQ